jgi:hypothetical protein
LPSQKPVVPHLAAPASEQLPVGSTPPGRIGVHAPTLPSTAHDMQRALQALAQQTPWAQMPDRHSVPSVPHGAPTGRSPHVPLPHTAGGAQSASAVQLFLHAAMPHRNGKHELATGGTQVPAPSQAAPGVKVVVMQVGSLHGVPPAYFWHAPASHLPSVPQLAAPWSVHVLAGSGAPGGTLVQIPIELDSAQDLQAPVQEVPQHTPCAQLPEAHSVLSEQNAPFVFLPHELPLQTLPVVQLASVVQAVKHFEPLQANGAQASVSGTTQAPASQWAGGV